MAAERFSCTSYEATCKPSHHSEHFYPGQLHHIGRHYDLFRNDRPFRLVIVGQDAGSTARVDLDSRRRDILATGTDRRFRKEGEHTSRNRHMRGTTSLLRLIFFGKGLGRDYNGEFLPVGSEMVHLFDCFSLVNFLLCSALVTGLEARHGARSSRPTKEMYEQCGRHFRNAIEILEPTHIVVQGPVVREWIGRHWALLGKEFELPRARVFPGFTWRAAEKIRIKDNVAELLSFYHPSARAPAVRTMGTTKLPLTSSTSYSRRLRAR